MLRQPRCHGESRRVVTRGLTVSGEFTMSNARPASELLDSSSELGMTRFDRLANPPALRDGHRLSIYLLVHLVAYPYLANYPDRHVVARLGAIDLAMFDLHRIHGLF